MWTALLIASFVLLFICRNYNINKVGKKPMTKEERQKQRESERKQRELEATISEFPFEADGLDYKAIHKKLCDRFRYGYTLSTILNSLFTEFYSLETTFELNRNWLLKYCPKVLGYELGIYFNDSEFMDEFAVDDNHKEEIIVDLLPYCEKPHVRKALEKIGPVDEKRMRNIFAYYLGTLESLFAKKDAELLRFADRLLPNQKILDGNHCTLVRHSDYNFGCTWEHTSLLNNAVEADDVELVRFLLEIGADPNEYLYSFWNRDKKSPAQNDIPIISHIKSQQVFNLMAKAGMKLYPTSGSREEIENGQGKPIILDDNIVKWRAEWENVHPNHADAIKQETN